MARPKKFKDSTTFQIQIEKKDLERYNRIIDLCGIVALGDIVRIAVKKEFKYGFLNCQKCKEPILHDSQISDAAGVMGKCRACGENYDIEFNRPAPEMQEYDGHEPVGEPYHTYTENGVNLVFPTKEIFESYIKSLQSSIASNAAILKKVEDSLKK